MLHSTDSLWSLPADAPKYAPLSRDIQVDVAVVGAGITGVTAAVLLKQAGQSVALLEARTLGSGVTGGTTAHLTEAVDARYYSIEKDFGRESAALVRESSRKAIEELAALSERFGVAHAFERVPGVLFTEEPEKKGELEQEYEAARRAGAAVELGAVALPFPTAAGLHFANQAQLSPLIYLEALARSIPGAGSAVFEHTRVQDVELGEPLKVWTQSGALVHAKYVIYATHAPPVVGPFQTKVAQYRSYVCAGPSPSPVRGLYWDMQDPYHYVRSADCRGVSYLVVGGSDHKTGKGPKRGPASAFDDVIAYAGRFGVTATRRWSAQVVEPVDGLPYIGRLKDDEPIFVATGFSGNGTTFGTLSAMMLRDAILGRTNPYAQLYRATRFKPLVSLAPVIEENAAFPARLVKDRLTVEAHALAEIMPGDGKVLRAGHEKLAVYRDTSGKLHAVSARCPHMGCNVTFNRVELSWDCPCHGSRFKTDGSLLDGPATKPLEARAIPEEDVSDLSAHS